MINANRKKISDILKNQEIGTQCTLFGWIKTARFSKNVYFLSINDGSCFDKIQVVIDNIENVDKSQLLTGACVKIEGTVVESPGKNQSCEILASHVEVIGTADDKFPLQKKRHTLEFLRTMPHLRTRTNTLMATFNVRSKLAMAIHEYFQSKGFVYIHPPILTNSDCEGAGETFQVTNLDLDALAASGKKVDYSQDFFGEPVSLTVSGQLEAEAFAMSHGEVYTFAPAFRADPSTTQIHAAEFWMIEPEMAFYDFEDLLILIEEFVKAITQRIKDSCQTELAFFSQFINKELMARYDAILNNAFGRISYTEAIDILIRHKDQFENEPVWGEDLFKEHERYLTDVHFKKPVFITDYPASFKSFYMRQNEDGKTVACVDLLAPQVGEIVGGSQREERLDVLKTKIQEKGMVEETYKWYMELRQWGSAPHSGFGLGFERMLMYLTGMENIRDAIPFPRAKGQIYG